MRSITNGTKHCSRSDRNLKTKIMEGHYSSLHYDRRYYNVPRFVIEVKDKQIDFEETLIKTIKFWESFIENPNMY